MAAIMKGSEVVSAINAEITARAAALHARGITPCLAIVRLGERADDLAYERAAVKRCEGVGVKCTVHAHPDDMTQAGLMREIQRLNADPDIHGILLFRPLPGQIEEQAIKHAIDPGKDVDCLSPVNVAKVFEGDDTGFAPCTPEAVLEILQHYRIDLAGKRVAVIGRSLVVGKPLAMLLLKRNATVTICHTKTKDLEETCRAAEVLIAAAGKARMVTAAFAAPGQVVVDVGINVDGEGNLCGDVDFENMAKIVETITPVPGGVGTVTTSVLAKHVVRAAESQAG